MGHEDRKPEDAETEKKLDAILTGNAATCGVCGHTLHIEEDDYTRVNGQEVHMDCLEDMEERE